MKKAYDKFLAMFVFMIASYVFTYTYIWYKWTKRSVRKFLPKSKQYELQIANK
jgi:hypothetical protein